MSIRKLKYQIHRGDSPFLAVALHDGHDIRDELMPDMIISDADRLREEDPFTGQWANIADNRIIVETSRFEVDLNRPREEAVYIKPEDAWGLKIWDQEPSPKVVDQTLEGYDAFYADVYEVLEDMQKRHGKFLVYDFHSYNHMRNGPDGPPADPEGNPEVNIGTGTMLDRAQWAPVIDQFISDLLSYDYFGRNLDVRENIKFYGRKLAEFVHTNFPESGCVLSVEFKKFFMDEWTGVPDQAQLDEINKALQQTIPNALKKL